MAEEKSRQIPIEDGNAKAEEELKEELKKETCGTESEEKPEEKTEEKSSEEAAEESAEKQSDDGKAAEQARAEAEESERYMRLMAEFQNFKKRAAREKSDIHAYANEKIIGELLPVLDNFERALTAEPTDVQGYIKGMELIFTQLKTALEHAGLAEIPALGEEFDPKVHNAVMTSDSEDYDDGRISMVMQKGYTLNDKVIRPSMVAVVRK